MTLPRGFLPSDVRDRARVSVIGGRVNSDPLDEIRNGINQAPQAKKVDTITVATATDSTDYTVSVGGATIVYTSGVGATKASIVEGLLAAILDEPIAGARVTGTEDGVDTLTLTGRIPGDDYTVDESDARLTHAHVTAADEADPIYFGRALINVEGFASGEDDELFCLASDSYLGIQVATVDYTYQNGYVLGVRVTDKHTGKIVCMAEHTMATSKDASTTALAAILNAEAAANSVIFSNAGATGYELVCTSEKEGLEFEVDVWANKSDVVPSVAYTTGPTVATSLLRAFRGVSLFAEDQEAPTIDADEAYYPGNSTVMALAKGEVWVENTESPTQNDVVYVETDSTSANCGKFYKATSATRLPLPRSVAMWARYSSADGMAVLRVNVDNR
jgi:hypothetical protein